VLIQETYTEVHLDIANTLASLAPVQASATTHALENVLGVIIGKGAKPTAEYIASVAKNVLIQGSPLDAWMEKQAGDLQFRLSAEIRQGVIAGETNQQIISRIVGTKETPGVMKMARSNAAALVQTSTATIANSARMETYRKNADIIKGVRWSSTLDGHTCESCGVRDGLKWDLNGNGLDGNTLPYAEPPLHPNCRCGMIAVLKPMSEVSGGKLKDLPDHKTRASSGGQVSAKMTFTDWFANRTPEQQNEQFGVVRAQMFRDGKLTLRDMLDQSGNPLSMDALRKKYP
jgi:SPP1 gp7 family putative phage head morphogenesis protein